MDNIEVSSPYTHLTTITLDKNNAKKIINWVCYQFNHPM